MTRLPIPMAPYAAIPGAETLFLQPAAQYPSAPPGLIAFRAPNAALRREFLTVVSRPYTPCPPEAVMHYRDALVLDGIYVLSRDGIAVQESYYNVARTPALAAQQAAQRTRIAAGDLATLPASGPPVVALFAQDCNNFGHILAEMLPRLLHLESLGLREIRLLLPDAAQPFLPIIGFTLATLGLRAAFISCPPGSILRVPALHWVSLVGQGWFKSPTVRRLFQRLRQAAPPPGPHPRLFVARPAEGRRVVTNAPELEAIAEAAGFSVVEPSRLAFPDQIALFAGTRAAAGPFGAALTLMAAMEEGGRVGMIGPGYRDYFYWDLACLAGLRIDWAFTGPLEPSPDALLFAPMAVDPRLLRRTLAGLAA